MVTILWPLELSPRFRFNAAARAEPTVIAESDADQSGIALIQLLVIRPLKCVCVWFKVDECQKGYESQQQDNSLRQIIHSLTHHFVQIIIY